MSSQIALQHEIWSYMVIVLLHLLNLGLDVFAITSCVGMHIFMNASLL